MEPQNNIILKALLANYFGLKSKGLKQVRGGGKLILTDQELYFNQTGTKTELRIPISKIRAIETPRSFLGKSQMIKLLKVIFEDEDGNLDAVAWGVKGLKKEWVPNLERLINKS